MENDTFPFTEEGACLKIIRTWYVIDWCIDADEPGGALNPYSNEQVIKVNNTIAPEFVNVPADTTICSYAADCGPVTLSGYLIASATDDCTNTDELLTSYEVRTESGTVVQTGAGLDASGTYAVGSYNVLYRAEDLCGNPTVATSSFTIQNCKLPTPYCLNGLSTALVAMDLDNDGTPEVEMAELTPAFFDAGSYHPCGYEVSLSFSADVNDTLLVLDCNDADERVIVELWVTDENGGQDYCTTYVDVADNNGIDIPCESITGPGVDVQGRLYTSDDVEVEGVVVELSGGEVADEVTAADGMYEFADMPMGGSYEIVPTKDDDHRNGVNTLDLVLIQRHILELELLDSPYKMIAADINKDGSLKASDLLSLRKLILGVSDNFPNNTSWRFIDEAHEFASVEGTLAEQYAETYDIVSLEEDMWVDFIGVKVGDVNGDAVAHLKGGTGTSSRSQSTLQLSMQEAELAAGQTVDIPVYAGAASELHGLQLSYDLGGLTVVDVIPGKLALDQRSTAVVDGELRISHGERAGVAVSAGDVLYTLRLRAREAGSLSSQLSMTTSHMDNEVYVAEALEVQQVVTEWSVSEVTTTAAIGVLRASQNTPNPWKASTTIMVEVPASGDVSVRVRDAQGRVVYVKTSYLTQGSHEWTITSEDVGQSGIYLYEVESGSELVNGKMIRID